MFLPPFEESNIYDGWVEINKLKYKHFKRKLVLMLCLGSMHLCKIRRKTSQLILNPQIYYLFQTDPPETFNLSVFEWKYIHK